MDEATIGILIITTVVVVAVGIGFLATGRKLDEHHTHTQGRLNEIQTEVKGSTEQLNNRMDREGKEALHGITQLRVRFTELWNDRKEAFMQWWDRQ